MSYKKVIVSNHVIEVYEMDKEPFNPHLMEFDSDYEALDIALNGEEHKRKMEAFREEQERRKDERECRKEERRMQTVRDNRNKCRRLILNNFDNNSKFVTLTFKDNVTDVSAANIEFKKFIQRMRTRFGDFKYLTVIEFQKRGAVHYHMISDLPYIQKELLYAIWQNRKITRSKKSKFYCVGDGYKIEKSRDGNRDIVVPEVINTKQGFVRINNIEGCDNVGAYVTKYMTKDNDDERLLGNKMYLVSKGLEQSKVYTGAEAEEVIKFYLKNKKRVYDSSYTNEYLGQITYKEYNLNRED